MREAAPAQLAKCDTAAKIEELLKSDVTKDVDFAAVATNTVKADGARIAKTEWNPYNRAVLTWIREMKGTPEIIEDVDQEMNVAWTTGTGAALKTYISEPLFVKFTVKPIDKSAAALSWGAAAVSAAAALYL